MIPCVSVHGVKKSISDERVPEDLTVLLWTPLHVRVHVRVHVRNCACTCACM